MNSERGRKEPEDDQGNNVEILDSHHEGTEWMGRLANIYGEPHLVFRGDSKTPIEIVRFLIPPFRGTSQLSVSRFIGDEDPRFRVDLSTTRNGHPSSVYCSSCRNIRIDPSSGVCEFSDDDTRFEIADTGKYAFESIEDIAH